MTVSHNFVPGDLVNITISFSAYESIQMKEKDQIILHKIILHNLLDCRDAATFGILLSSISGQKKIYTNDINNALIVSSICYVLSPLDLGWRFTRSMRLIQRKERNDK
jgi:hypothetical protein